MGKKSSCFVRYFLFIIFLGFFSSGIFSGCLKTRSQLRPDANEPNLDTRESHSVSVSPPENVQGNEGSSVASASGGYVLDEMKQELIRIEGRLEELERARQLEIQTSSQSPSWKDELKQVDIRLTQLEQTQENFQALKDPAMLFKKAKEQFDGQDYQQAAYTFGLLNDVSKSKNVHKILEEALFLRAESFFKLKEYKKAAIDYSKFLEKYPKSSHASDVLFKVGLSFESLGMKEDAHGFFQELLEKYPKSIEAKKAKKKAK